MLYAILALQVIILVAAVVWAIHHFSTLTAQRRGTEALAHSTSTVHAAVGEALSAFGAMQQQLASSAQSLAGASAAATALTRAAEDIQRTTAELLPAVTDLAALRHRLVPDDSPSDWLDAAARATGPEALALLDIGLRRHPHSADLLQVLASAFEQARAAFPDPLVQREVVVRLSARTDRFIDSCVAADVPLGRTMRQTVDAMADDVLSSVMRTQRQRLEAQLAALEERVQHLLARQGLSSEEMDSLARLDDAIDKAQLQSHSTLRTRYADVSQRLVEYFREAERVKADDDTLRYNLNAVTAAKRAIGLYDAHGRAYRKGQRNISDLVQLLGGWDSRALLPATATYTATVYSEIFQGLEPEVRLALTRGMIEARTRPVASR